MFALAVIVVARRTLRTSLRFIARQVVPHLDPADAPLPRERAKKPYTAGEIAGYLALAGAQPTAARQARAAGLICLGAGAGLIRSDLRNVRGTDICGRSGGVIVEARLPISSVADLLPAPHRCCCLSQASRMRWLRTVIRQASQSMSGVWPVRRIQPRSMLLTAVSLIVAWSRSATQM